MKMLFVALSFLVAQSTVASTSSHSLKCSKEAIAAAIKLSELSRAEFDKEMPMIWACKTKVDPTTEEIQFGDGSGLIGVSLKIENGKCVVKDVYSGQDDQDGSESWDSANCLP